MNIQNLSALSVCTIKQILGNRCLIMPTLKAFYKMLHIKNAKTRYNTAVRNFFCRMFKISIAITDAPE